MSQIKLAPNASGTGIFTIDSPNSNTNRTLTLPDATGTIITTAGGAAISGTTGTFTGLVDISAAGAGQIQFPATQNASSNANTLDDYEEGSFTPVINGGANPGTGTYTTQVGRYTRIGNLVTVVGNVHWTAHTGTGNPIIGGLPFTILNVADYYPSASFGYVNNMALTANNLMIGRGILNSTTLVLYQYPTGGGAVTELAFDSSAQIIFSMSYQV